MLFVLVFRCLQTHTNVKLEDMSTCSPAITCIIITLTFIRCACPSIHHHALLKRESPHHRQHGMIQCQITTFTKHISTYIKGTINHDDQLWQHHHLKHLSKHNRHHKYHYARAHDDEDSIELDATEEPQQEYSDKKQLVALLLSIFFGEFGADRFYIGRYVTASFKLLLPLLLCCAVFCIFCTAGLITGGQALRLTRSLDSEPDEDGLWNWNSLTQIGGCLACITMVLLPCGLCGWFIWILVDILLFALNEIPDEDGNLLQPI